jgi:CRP/FNR family transcriptional regulator, cyclic AMP receptor protein
MSDASKKDLLAGARRLIENCVLFKGLSDSERSAISARARIRTFDAGETIFAIGSPGDQMMAILSGTVRISLPSNEGKELLLAIIHPGEVFGELAVLDGKERSADALAESACSLAILDRRDILSFFERNPSAWLKIVEVLCHRLRRTDQVLAEVALMQLPTRLAKMMLRITKPSPVEQMEKIRFSQRELASMVGGTRESVNKCLRKWQSGGIVQVSESWIAITDRAALEKLAEHG